MDALCTGCKAKEQPEDRGAVTVVAVGHQAWDLCAEHADRFARYLSKALRANGSEKPVDERRSAVVTGSIPGYEPEAARRGLENSGYRIVGHVEEDTVLIVCGIRPAPHKVKEAGAAGTPCLDATRAGAFREAVTSGRWIGEDPLPTVPEKKTADAVRAQMEAEEKWRLEKNQRLAESSDRWAEERREKEDAETRHTAKAKLLPEPSEAEKIRAWARKSGFTVSTKGRIAAAVRVAYEHAHAGQETLDVEAS
ncbi:histone-like nucleoid-structuring protein Lsr2 [Streptomyces sp. NPDC048644]|uniref:Lsr2 family DNA-binding protein n=1 Tax=Streptomyces sp. NPDC048644 TaxID=3365582 RepID=UPI00371FA587